MHGLRECEPETVAAAAAQSLFDAAWYLRQYADVAAAGIDPWEHYLAYGAAEGRNPHPLFDTAYYLKQCPEVATGRLNPLIHFFQAGAAQGRSPCRLFDAAYYRRQYPDVGGTNPLVHFLEHGGRDPHPLFDSAFYLRSYPDVAASGINPLVHFLQHGVWEGRVAFSTQKILAAAAAEATGGRHGHACAAMPNLRVPGGNGATRAPVAVLAHREGNFFFQEIRDLLVAGLRRCGLDASAGDERTDPRSLAGFPLVVAPHEFFCLGTGRGWARPEVLRECILISTEQPQTNWFASSLPLLFQARLLLDINFQNVGLLRRMGLEARFLPLGFLERYAPLDDDAPLPETRAMGSFPPAVRQHVASREQTLAQRPLDLFFLGTNSPRRERFFAARAARWSRYRSAFFLPPSRAPLLAARPQTVGTAEAVALAQRSKIVLNVHRDEFPYFEWQRIVLRGIWQRSLVLSEPSLPVPGLRPGEHYIEAPLHEFSDRIDWLLTTAAGQAHAEAVRQAGYAALRQEFDLPTILQELAVAHLANKS